MTDEKLPQASEQALYDEMLTVNTSPHIKHTATTTRIMLDVLIALTPALVWGVVVFGLNALLMPLIAVGASVLFEYLTAKLLHSR